MSQKKNNGDCQNSSLTLSATQNQKVANFTMSIISEIEERFWLIAAGYGVCNSEEQRELLTENACAISLLRDGHDIDLPNLSTDEISLASAFMLLQVAKAREDAQSKIFFMNAASSCIGYLEGKFSRRKLTSVQEELAGLKDQVIEIYVERAKSYHSKIARDGRPNRHGNRDTLKKKAREMYRNGPWDNPHQAANALAPLLLAEARTMHPPPLSSPERSKATVYGWLLEEDDV